MTDEFSLIFDFSGSSLRKSLRFAFNKAKNEIPSSFKSLVNGYIRDQQNKLLLGQNIPSVIMYICILYYYDGEYFTQSNEDLSISKDKRTVTKIKNNLYRPWKNRAIGNIWVGSMSNKIVKWKFIINRTTGGLNTIFVALISVDTHLDNEFFAYPILDAPIYSIGNGYTVCAYDGRHANQVDIGPLFVVGYQFSIILNTKDSTICYEFDDDITTRKCIFADIVRAESVRYKIAVCLKSLNASMSLIEFAEMQ